MPIRTAMLCVVLLTSFLPAQMPEGTWLGWTLSLPGSCGVCAYLPDGTQVNGIDLGSLVAPHVIKHKLGLVYGVNPGGGVLQIFGSGLLLGAVPLPGLTDVAVLPSGRFTVLDGSIFFGRSVAQYDVSGALLWRTTLPMGNQQTIRSDPLGRSWAVDTAGNIDVIDNLGAVIGAYPRPLGGSPVIMAFEMDRAGRGWILRDGLAGASFLQRLEVPSGAALQLNIPFSLAMDIDVQGRIRVLRDTPTGEVIDAYDADSGALLSTIALSQSASYDSMVIDSAGNIWLELGQNGQGYDVYDPEGNYRTTITNALTVGLTRGDPTGVHMINCDPLGDADGDGVSNTQEVSLGSDPGLASSTPPTVSVVSAPTVGVGFTVMLESVTEPGAAYVCGLSGGEAGIPIGGTVLSVPLTADPLLNWWISSLNTVGTGVTGVLDSSGQALVSAAITPILGNVPVSLAFVTLGSGGTTVRSISLPLQLVLP